MEDSEVIAALVATGLWGADDVRLGLRAGFRCEYCGFDLLASPEAYKQWQKDHLIPASAGGTDDPENLVLACWTCNVHWKSRWDPRPMLPGHATRADLIAAARAHIAARREKAAATLDAVRAIVRRQGEIRP